MGGDGAGRVRAGRPGCSQRAWPSLANWEHLRQRHRADQPGACGAGAGGPHSGDGAARGGPGPLPQAGDKRGIANRAEATWGGCAGAGQVRAGRSAVFTRAWPCGANWRKGAVSPYRCIVWGCWRAWRGRPLLSATAARAASALRTALGAPLNPKDTARYTQALAALRAALGEEAVRQPGPEGRVLALDEAVCPGAGRRTGKRSARHPDAQDEQGIAGVPDAAAGNGDRRL